MELLARAGVLGLPQAPPPIFVVGLLAPCHPEDGRCDAWVDGWVYEENSGLVEAANAGWFALACEHGLFGEDQEFLLAVPAEQQDDDGDEVFEWRRVRLLDEWDLVGAGAELLGSGSERPKMSMSSLDGSIVMRITTYPSGVSSIVLPEPWRAATVRSHMGRIAELAAQANRADVPTPPGR